MRWECFNLKCSFNGYKVQTKKEGGLYITTVMDDKVIHERYSDNTKTAIKVHYYMCAVYGGKA